MHENLLCVDAVYLSKIKVTTTTTTISTHLEFAQVHTRLLLIYNSYIIIQWLLNYKDTAFTITKFSMFLITSLLQYYNYSAIPFDIAIRSIIVAISLLSWFDVLVVS